MSTEPFTSNSNHPEETQVCPWGTPGWLSSGPSDPSLEQHLLLADCEGRARRWQGIGEDSAVPGPGKGTGPFILPGRLASATAAPGLSFVMVTARVAGNEAHGKSHRGHRRGPQAPVRTFLL